MAQIRHSQFAVSRNSTEDVDLVDLADGRTVCVEKEHRYYSGELHSLIQALEEGDTFIAQIQGEDVLQPNSIWHFIDIIPISQSPL